MDTAPEILAELPPVLTVVAAPQKDAQCDIKLPACRRFVQDKIRLRLRGSKSNLSGQQFSRSAETYVIAKDFAAELALLR